MEEQEIKETMETAETTVRKAETALGKRFEARLHEIGKELCQDYEITKEFVRRVFEGMPAHVQPGSVAPYNVTAPSQQVIQQKLYREGADGLADIDRIVAQTKDRSGPPDITR